jgi:DNA-binding response OmpR family regulator
VNERIHKILVVDDDPTFRRAVSRLLEAKGYLVSEESRILVVIKTIMDQNPDLILLDLYMPEVRGVDIVKTMREMNIDIPIVVISGHINMEDFQILHEYGINDILVKPVDLKTLLDKVKSVLNRKAQMPGAEREQE